MKTLSLFVVVVVVVALKWTAGYVTNDDDDVWQAPSYLGQVDAQFCFPFSPPMSPFSCIALHRIWFAVGGSRRRVSCIMDND